MSDMKETDFPPLEPQPFVTEEGQEIERLRAELAAAKDELAKVRQQRDEACQRTYNAGFVEASRIHGIEIQQMRQQRDEARRMWCRIISLQRRGARENFFPEDIAVEYGWDCYSAKEGGGA